MKVAVITPYHTEPLDMLKRAHDSVMAQTHPCTHYMVADGHARAEINEWPVRHIPLPVEHNNNGNTPRGIGSLDAMGDGFDAIAYLDADNWYDPDHIAGLITLHKETGADLVSSGRVIHALDGGILMEEGEPGDGDHHTDTSALLVFENAFSVIPIWSLMPDELGPNCDRVFFQAAARLKLRHEHINRTSMHFTSRYGPHYRAAGRPVPKDAVGMVGIKESSDFARRMVAMDCKDIMSRKAISDVKRARLGKPITIIVLADEDTLGSEETAVINGLESKLESGTEFYFTTPEELEAEADITKTRLNVFVIVFEDHITELISVEQLLEHREDLRIIYLRSASLDDSATVTSVIDNRAFKILVRDEMLKDHYHNQNRYGAGHVIVTEKVDDMTEIFQAAIQAATE